MLDVLLVEVLSGSAASTVVATPSTVMIIDRLSFLVVKTEKRSLRYL
jgi:hypothetical protein